MPFRNSVKLIFKKPKISLETKKRMRNCYVISNFLIWQSMLDNFLKIKKRLKPTEMKIFPTNTKNNINRAMKKFKELEKK